MSSWSSFVSYCKRENKEGTVSLGRVRTRVSRTESKGRAANLEELEDLLVRSEVESDGFGSTFFVGGGAGSEDGSGSLTELVPGGLIGKSVEKISLREDVR